MKSNKSILLVGGGTGGHLVPVYYVYKELKKHDRYKINVLGSGSEFENMFFHNNPDYKIINTGKFNRSYTINNISELFKTILGLFQVLIYFMTNRPDVIFSKGGYVSFPVIFWAKLFKIPYFLHESDIVMGLSNKYAASCAKKVFVGYPEENYKNLKNIIYSGQIIKVNHDIGFDTNFGFTNKRSTIFVTGGSQGSSNINKSLASIVEKLLLSYNVIHQTGKADFDWIKSIKEGLNTEIKRNYYISDFLKRADIDMVSGAIQSSDLVISRAGANTIAEIAVLKKAMILIPYKHAAGDHQTKNAEFVSSRGGALVIEDDKLSSSILLDKINEAIEHKEEIGEKAYKLFREDGLNMIVSAILDEVNERSKK